MPDNYDLRMNQNETLNCKLALMGVWTEACREAAAYFGVNPDGSGNFSSVTQAQAARPRAHSPWTGSRPTR